MIDRRGLTSFSGYKFKHIGRLPLTALSTLYTVLVIYWRSPVEFMFTIFQMTIIPTSKGQKYFSNYYTYLPIIPRFFCKIVCIFPQICICRLISRAKKIKVLHEMDFLYDKLIITELRNVQASY